MGTDANFVYYVECYPVGSEDLGKGLKQEIDMIKLMFLIAYFGGSGRPP